jgi:hypothetical protein
MVTIRMEIIGEFPKSFTLPEHVETIKELESLVKVFTKIHRVDIESFINEAS